MGDIHWSTKKDTPSHLWPEKVRCPHEGCGTRVDRVGVRFPEGHVTWVCANGHDDVRSEFVRAIREDV